MNNENSICKEFTLHFITPARKQHLKYSTLESAKEDFETYRAYLKDTHKEFVKALQNTDKTYIIDVNKEEYLLFITEDKEKETFFIRSRGDKFALTTNAPFDLVSVAVKKYKPTEYLTSLGFEAEREGM